MSYNMTTSGVLVGSQTCKNCIPNRGVIGAENLNLIPATTQAFGTKTYSNTSGGEHTQTTNLELSEVAVDGFVRWVASATARAVCGAAFSSTAHTVNIKLPASGQYLDLNSKAVRSGGYTVVSGTATATVALGQGDSDVSKSISGTFIYYRIS